MTTKVSIKKDKFYINGRPTYEGRTWKDIEIEGLLINSRMIQGVFDDKNSQTVSRWAYPDTGEWDPERNTDEFVQAMEKWYEKGLLGFTINMQGGSPEGYSDEQPWYNSGFKTDGSIDKNYLNRLEKILDKADELGMIVILGYFYFGQDQRLKNERAVIAAARNMTHYILKNGYQNIMIEINNECDVSYSHEILRPERVHELINLVQEISNNQLLASASYGGGSIPEENVLETADYILIHGNGVEDPAEIEGMVHAIREKKAYKGQPIVFNEDDHFNFDQEMNNFIAAIKNGASWGYFDPGENNYHDGYQSPPVNWEINTDRKKAFFNLVEEITKFVK